MTDWAWAVIFIFAGTIGLVLWGLWRMFVRLDRKLAAHEKALCLSNQDPDRSWRGRQYLRVVPAVAALAGVAVLLRAAVRSYPMATTARVGAAAGAAALVLAAPASDQDASPAPAEALPPPPVTSAQQPPLPPSTAAPPSSSPAPHAAPATPRTMAAPRASSAVTSAAVPATSPSVVTASVTLPPPPVEVRLGPAETVDPGGTTHSGPLLPLLSALLAP